MMQALFPSCHRRTLDISCPSSGFFQCCTDGSTLIKTKHITFYSRVLEFHPGSGVKLKPLKQNKFLDLAATFGTTKGKIYDIY